VVGVEKISNENLQLQIYLEHLLIGLLRMVTNIKIVTPFVKEILVSSTEVGLQNRF
jgi:hypothetical protein